MTANSLKPIKRVMLIFPPVFDVKHVDTQICPPLGIAYLAAFVRDIVDVKLLDALVEAPRNRQHVNDKIELMGMSYDAVLEQIREYKPDMVGFSCVFSNQFASIKELARRAKSEVDKDIVTVAGGTHPSFMYERTLQTTYLDYIVLGEGELTFRGLIEAHNRGHGLDDLDGIAFRNGDGIEHHPRVHHIENLDEMPLPARDLLSMEKYFDAKVPMAIHYRKLRNTPLITSRGCPCHCAFCSSTVHWGNRYRTRSPENVLAEIEHLKNDYGVEELKFQDDNLTLPRKRAQAIFRGMVDRGLAMPWNTPNGVAIWTLDEELIKLMKKSGCYEMTLAVESGDQWVLDNIVKKPLKLEKAREAAYLARKHGIATTGYFIIGFPGENMQQIRNTLQFAMDIKLDYFIPFIFNPLPGSELWEVCREKGYLPEDYHYENANNYFQCDLDTEDFDPAELTRLQRLMYFKNLLKLPFRNPREFAAYYGRQFIHRPDFLRTFAMHVFKKS